MLLLQSNILIWNAATFWNISVIADVYLKHECFRPVGCSLQPMHPCELAFYPLLIMPPMVIEQAIGRYFIFSFFFAIAKWCKANPPAPLSQVFTCVGDISKLLHNLLSVLNSQSFYKMQHHPECYNREKNTKSKRINDGLVGPTVHSDSALL